MKKKKMDIKILPKNKLYPLYIKRKEEKKRKEKNEKSVSIIYPTFLHPSFFQQKNLNLSSINHQTEIKSLRSKFFG